MNHDNSRLLYTESENPGQPLRSQAEYHNAGWRPREAMIRRISPTSNWLSTRRSRPASNGSRKWKKMRMLGRPSSRKRLESQVAGPKLAKELTAGPAPEMALSCAAGKWDGDGNPRPNCRSALGRGANALGNNVGPVEAEIIGLAANLFLPFALKYTGMFWDVHGQYHVLERLAGEIGSDSGHYRFKK